MNILNEKLFDDVTGYFKNISELRAANEANGFYFFSRKTMKFFKSKIESQILKGKYFITSEQYGSDSPRQYSIREIASRKGDIKPNPFDRKFSSKERAKDFLKDNA